MASTRILFLLLALIAIVLAYECGSDEDCALNGECSDGTCQCYIGWKGDDCGALDLLPATFNTGYNRSSDGINTWGGKVLQDPNNSSLYHLFAAQFADGCNLNYWSPYSTIIRATSSSPMGPFTFAEEIVGTFAHNPSVIWSEAHQLYVMVHIGCPQTLPSSCSNIDISCDPGNHINGESGITMRVSKTLDFGDWQSLGIVFGADANGTWDCDTTNPSPYPLSNGSIVMAYRGCPFNCWGGEYINIAYADSLEGPYTRLHANPIFPDGNEDPFIWQDPQGNWHLLMHSLENGGGFGGPKVGRHAFARDFEGPWTFWNRTLAYNTTVEFDDGSSVNFFRRERPQLFLNEDGEMEYLINGVQEMNGNTITFIQPIRSD